MLLVPREAVIITFDTSYKTPLFFPSVLSPNVDITHGGLA